MTTSVPYLPARDGTIWIGNHSSLDYVRGNIVSSISPKNGLPGGRVTSLLEDHVGRLWVGVGNGLFVYEGGKFRPIRGRNGGAIGVVLEMTEDVDNAIWAIVVPAGPGKATELVQIQNGKSATENADRRLDIPISLSSNPEGGLWLGLSNGRLARYRNGQLQIFPLKNANARILQVLAESNGSVLAATTNGLSNGEEAPSLPWITITVCRATGSMRLLLTSNPSFGCTANAD